MYYLQVVVIGPKSRHQDRGKLKKRKAQAGGSADDLAGASGIGRLRLRWRHR